MTKNKNIQVSLLKEGIIHIHLKEHSEIALYDAELALIEMGNITKGKKFPVFIDAGEFCNIDDEVRIFSASEKGNIYTLADAIAYSNLGQKITAQFYLNKHKPKVPTKLFSNKKEAITWLKKIIV